MVTGTFTVACLLLAVGGGPPEVVHLNQKSFQIPIKIDPERRPLIAQVLLFEASKDGHEWRQVGAVPPDRDAFTYFAREDGPYMFKVAVEGKDRRRDPPDIYQAPLGLRVVIDTARPQLKIVQAERQGDEALVRWELIEEHPDLSSLKLEYRTTDGLGGLWREAKVIDPASHSARVRGSDGVPVAVRMQVQDLAGNTCGWVEAAVSVGAPAPPPVPGGAGTTAALPPAPASKPPVPPAPAPGLPPIGDSTGWSPGGPPEAPSKTSPLVQTGRTTPDPSEPGKETLPPAASGGKAPVLAQASGTTTSEAPGARAARPALPNVEWVRQRQITIDYEVAKFGPSGIASAQLYVTRDDGRTWTPSGGEENVNAPATLDGRGLPPVLKRSLSVTVPEDGPYGFYMVVRSGAGLGNAAPQPSTAPQMRIEVDTKAPEAELYAPEPDPAKRDSLVLHWSARDKNLGPNPVSLWWSEDGKEWKEIGLDLPHSGATGRHVWRVPQNVPPRVYLKLVVKDRAGNPSEAITPEPVTVDLSEPEVKSLKLGGSK